MSGIAAGIQYRRSISCSPQGAQLRDGLFPAGGQQGRKGQLEAAGEPGKEEGDPTPAEQKGLSKSLEGTAEVERQGMAGESSGQ